MDWQRAITRNREALLIIVFALMKSLGLVEGGQLTTLPNYLYRKALLILRQAESAARRLIMIAAHDMKVFGLRHPSPRATTNFSLLPARSYETPPAFKLIDPLKNFASDTLDFNNYDVANETYSGATDKKAVPATHLGKRLLALQRALDTIPKQAKRLALWYAQRDLALKQMRPHRLSPMRPGPPPTARRHQRSELVNILRECHLLAIDARKRRDSS